MPDSAQKIGALWRQIRPPDLTRLSSRQTKMILDRIHIGANVSI
jgi:hypothetical protein